MYFDAFPALDPNGTANGELTDAFGKMYRHEWNGVGSGQFTIHRTSTQVAWAGPGALIRVRLAAGGPFDYDDTRYVFAFWIEAGADVIVSPDEQGGENLTRGGRGALAYMQRAILYDQPQILPPETSAHPYPDGFWKWFNDQLGSILRRLITEDNLKAVPALPALTRSFSDTLDTDGNPWLDFGSLWQFPIGQDYLTCISQLRGQGITVDMRPNLEIDAWQDYTHPTRSVTFTKGVNIREAGDRALTGSAVVSRVLVQGTTEAGVTTYRETVDSGIESLVGRREAFLQYQLTPTAANLEKAGDEETARRRRLYDGPTTLGVLIRTGEVPYVDYAPGDIVTVNVPGEFDSVEAVIAALIVAETAAGEVDVTLDFGASSFDGVSSFQSGAALFTNAGPADCFDCADEVWQCDPADYTVVWDDDGGSGSVSLEEAGATTSAETALLYTGATYEVTYAVAHTTGSNSVAAWLKPTTGPATPYGYAGFGGRCPDSASSGVYTTAAIETFTPLETRNYALVGDCAAYVLCDNTGTVITATVRYVSGPDPRYADLEPCTTEPSVNQTVREIGSTGDGSTTSFTTGYAYTPLSMHLLVGGIDWTARIIETDPTTAAYALDYPIPLGANPVTLEYRRAA